MVSYSEINSMRKGKVWLVGAGPGDPDLLTVKALRVMQGAGLILFDQLVSEEIRGLFPRTVPAFYVGKRKGNHSIDQKDLNALLIKKAKQGLQVVRLKGGDPFVFGRGGEELMALLKAGVDAEVVPGITSASGCATAAAIPLTHRRLAQGCTFVTAQGETELKLDWQALARLDHTLVFYMGIGQAAMITTKLIAHGLAETTPIAVIENGCRPDQRTISGTLLSLPELIHEQKIQSPAIIVVGRVVSFASQLSTLQAQLQAQATAADQEFNRGLAC